MRAFWLVFGLGVCAVGVLGWAQVTSPAPVVLAGISEPPVPIGLATFSAPAGGRLDVQDPPGPKDTSKPPKAAPGQQGRGRGMANRPSKVSICHRTGSAERPSKTITVSERAWKAHERHGDTLGAC